MPTPRNWLIWLGHSLLALFLLVLFWQAVLFTQVIWWSRFDPDSTSFMRPSWGTRFSEMSRREITLMRAAILSLSTSGGCEMSRRMPSVRTRMR